MAQDGGHLAAQPEPGSRDEVLRVVQESYAKTVNEEVCAPLNPLKGRSDGSR